MSIKQLYYYIRLCKFLPHLMVYHWFSDRKLLDYERDMWLEKIGFIPERGTMGFLKLLDGYPEYRTLFYWRTNARRLSRWFPGQINLYIPMESNDVGKGLMIWHGYSTVINAKRIGENFQVWQNVTIGKKTTRTNNDKPVIGDNVSICTGAVCVGEIEVGNNVVIGANATVTKNVPNDTVVVNQTVRYLHKRDDSI